MPSPNSTKPEKLTAKQAKDKSTKLAKHFKDKKYKPMLDAVALATDQADIVELVLDALGVSHKLELG